MSDKQKMKEDWEYFLEALPIFDMEFLEDDGVKLWLGRPEGPTEAWSFEMDFFRENILPRLEFK